MDAFLVRKKFQKTMKFSLGTRGILVLASGSISSILLLRIGSFKVFKRIKIRVYHLCNTELEFANNFIKSALKSLQLISLKCKLNGVRFHLLY